MAPRGVARSPSPDTSADDIPPLAFDTEEELLAVFARMREDLLRRVADKWEREGGAKGKGKAVDRKKVEDIVLKVSSLAPTHSGGSLQDSGEEDSLSECGERVECCRRFAGVGQGVGGYIGSVLPPCPSLGTHGAGPGQQH